MKTFLDNILNVISGYVPSILGSLAILIIGWLIAWIVAAMIKNLLLKTSIDNKLGGFFGGTEGKEGFKIEEWISRFVFWLIMIFVLIAFFQTLNLSIVTEPLNNLLAEIFTYAPKILGALVLFILAWLIATAVRALIVKVLNTTNIDRKLADKAGMSEEKNIPISKSMGDIAYWLIFLLFLPAILSSLELEGILSPIQGMINEILAYLPNLFSAALIILVGWFVARLVSKIVSSLLAATGIDKLGEKSGLDNVTGEKKLSSIIGMIIYVLILIPIAIASLNTLGLDALTNPASSMLEQIMNTLPSLFAAIIIVAIAFIVAKLISVFIANLLKGVGFNKVVQSLGFKEIDENSKNSPANLVGYIVFITILLFSIIEALSMLGFESLNMITSEFVVFGGHILLGLIIFGFGLYIANLASDTIKASGAKNSSFFAMFAKVSILVFTGSMALREMGLADEIITLAFGLILGAIAVAFAIAFGLGAKDWAGKKISGLDKYLSDK